MSESVKNNYCWVYLLECNNGNFYTGVTKNINKRIEQHNSGNGAVYTKKYGPVYLVYYEKYPNRSFAMKREYEIKHSLTHTQKKKLVNDFLAPKTS